MKNVIPYVLVLALVLMGTVYYLNSNQTTGASIEELSATRENSDGMVTVSIRFLNPASPEYGDILAFQVGLNTHSVNLDIFDVQEGVYLRTGNGQTIKAIKWEEPDTSGGHHRKGILLFPLIEQDLEQGGFDIVIEGLAGIDERTFSW